MKRIKKGRRKAFNQLHTTIDADFCYTLLNCVLREKMKIYSFGEKKLMDQRVNDHTVYEIYVLIK